MYTEHLKRAFAKMGAKLHVEVETIKQQVRVDHQYRWKKGKRVLEKAVHPIPFSSYVLDIIEQPRKEFYHLKISHSEIAPLDLHVIDLQPKRRHLLLLAKEGRSSMMDKLLCGHDERHWFVSTLRSDAPISNVEQAMESLKPTQVLSSQLRQKVKRKNWHKRRNSGFVRQGEWFFLPRPNFQPDKNAIILKNEPFRRDWRSKPHIIEEVIRTGGEKVYVSRKFLSGILEANYQKKLKQNPNLKYENWRIMRRNPEVYVRGKVRHADHKTIILPYWHQVVMNREQTNGRVAFLD